MYMSKKDWRELQARRDADREALYRIQRALATLHSGMPTSVAERYLQDAIAILTTQTQAITKEGDKT